MSYAQLSSSFDQRPSYSGPLVVNMNNNDLISTDITNNNGYITVNTPGIYFVVASPQVDKCKNECSDYLDFWFAVNKIQVPNTGIRISMLSHKETDVIVCQGLLTLSAGDILTVVMNYVSHGESKNKDKIGIVAIQPKHGPLIPSIIFTMFNLSNLTSLSPTVLPNALPHATVAVNPNIIKH